MIRNVELAAAALLLLVGCALVLAGRLARRP